LKLTVGHFAYFEVPSVLR